MKKKIFVFLFVFLALFCFTGCKKKDTTKEVNNNVKVVKKMKSIVGVYTLIEIQDGDVSYNEQDIASLKNYGYDITMEFRKDKTGTLKALKKESEFTYSDKYIRVDGETVNYTYENDIVHFEKDGSTMSFRKVKDE